MTVITHVEDLRVLAQKRVPRMFYDCLLYTSDAADE